jgi:potassium-dependent mechanosensitive channel
MNDIIEPLLESTSSTFQNLWNLVLLDSSLGTLKLGNLVLGVLFFVVGWLLLTLLVKRFIYPVIEKLISEKELRTWTENFIGFIVFLHVIVLTLLILGFKGSILHYVWSLTIFTIGERGISIGNVVIGLMLLFVGIKFSSYLTKIFQSLVLKRMFVEESSAFNSLTVVFKVGMLFILILFTLSMIGIPLTAFTVIGGALAIGFGLGSQNLVNNFLSGLVLMLEKPLKIGDTVEAASRHGKVEFIGPRSTRIRTEGNMRLVIPNSHILDNVVVNYSLMDNMLRRELDVGVAYGSDVQKVKEILLQVADEHPKVLKDPEPLLLFFDFGDNALVFRLYFYMEFERFIQRHIIASDIRFRVDELFRENGITIAFPQRDVHLDTLKPLDVRVTNSSRSAGAAGGDEAMI